MHRRGADLDLAATLADAGQAGNARDVDQPIGLAQPQLHQRHEAVTAGDELAAAGTEFRDRIVEGRRTLVAERDGDHDRPPWATDGADDAELIRRHSFSGRSIMSMCFTPSGLSASTAAETMLGVDPSVPASPTPFAPSGFTGVGVTVADISNRGKSLARGMA